MTFASDLAFSQKYENELINLIKGHVKVETSQDKGLFKEWDVRFTFEDGHTEAHEVKCDRNGYKTGNVLVEFECSGQPSGIQTTKSDYYSFFIISPNGDYTCIILETEHVRQQINNNKYTRIIDMRGRDENNNGRLYLFNIDTLIGDCGMEDLPVEPESSEEEEEPIKNDTNNAQNDKTKCTVFAPWLDDDYDTGSE